MSTLPASASPHTLPVWALLQSVSDPEIPVLSVIDLGVVRDVAVDDQHVTVTITPTYTGCPAMDAIANNIREALLDAGYHNPTIDYQLSPAWTTDWMTERGRQRLRDYGIAPPVEPIGDPHALFAPEPTIPCPRCNSTHTHVVSPFGSTACKALYQCDDCKEPFDYFKCHR